MFLDVWPVVSMVLSTVFLWAIWSLKQVVRSEMAEMRRDLEGRIAHIEASQEGRPTLDDFERISERMAQMHGTMERLSGLMEANTHQVRLLVEHHIRNGG